MRLQVQGELSSNNGAGAQPRGVVRFLLISTLYCNLKYLPYLNYQYQQWHCYLYLQTITTLQLGTLVSVARNEGLTALYSGIVPGLQRQMAFSAIRCHVETDFKFRFKEKVKLSFWQLKYPGSEPTSRWRKSTWTLPGRAVDLVWWAAGLLLVLPQVRSLSGFRCGEGGVIRWWWLVMASKLGSSWCPLSRHPGNPCCSTDWCCQGNILVQNQCNA